MLQIWIFFIVFILGCAHRAPSLSPTIPEHDSVKVQKEHTQFEVRFFVDRGEDTNVLLPPQESLFAGDKLTIELEWTGDSAHLFLVSVGPEGDVYQLVPSDLEPDDLLRRGAPRSFGPFSVIPPAGTETLLFIVTSEKVPVEVLAREAVRFLRAWVIDPSSQHSFVWDFEGETFRGISERGVQARGLTFAPVPALSKSKEVTVATGFIFLKSRPAP